MKNNNNEENKLTQYESTAYQGKADPYYRENIAGPDERKRHLAKGQCQLGVFPRVKIVGSCWDANQSLPHIKDGDSVAKNNYNNFHTEPEELRLPLNSLSQNTKEVVFLSWFYLHVGVMAVLPVYLLIGLVFNGWSDLLDNMDVLVIGITSLLASKYLYRLLEKFNLTPTGHFVIFNRQTGMVEIANDERTGYHYLPFEQFNAHHRTVHSERGAPSYGFTLLHYQQDLMYQVADKVSVEDALVHWELIKNFMDTREPLADIPQFECYRAYDPTTVLHDRKNGRPTDFWYRVDEKFIKKIAKVAFKAVHDFPTKKADTLHEALQHGYRVPDIINSPWREAENISEQFVDVKASWFIRYIVAPIFIF